MSSRLSGLIVLVAALGCDRAREPARSEAPVDARVVASDAGAGAPPAPSSAESIVEGGAPPDPEAVARAFVAARPVGGKSIGNTSVAFKVKLEGGLEASFKPRSKRGGLRYRSEAAAYRLATALGLFNVPPAYVRTFDAQELRAALGEPAMQLFDAEVISEGGRVAGAIMPWRAKFEILALEKPPLRAKWPAWLAKDGALDEADRKLAAQISTMLAFDYLTANWDRWSGGNIVIDRASGTLLFVDNDAAFYEPPPATATATQLGFVRDTHRFSRSFVAALRALDSAGLAAATGEESPGVPLVPPKALAAMDARRRAILSLVDAKAKAEGDAAVYAFE